MPPAFSAVPAVWDVEAAELICDNLDMVIDSDLLRVTLTAEEVVTIRTELECSGCTRPGDA